MDALEEWYNSVFSPMVTSGPEAKHRRASYGSSPAISMGETRDAGGVVEGGDAETPMLPSLARGRGRRSSGGGRRSQSHRQHHRPPVVVLLEDVEGMDKQV